MNKTLTGAVVAAAVAGLFLSGSSMAKTHGGAKMAKVHCSGVNACKGKGMCKSADNACKGKNSCKGKGWVSMKSEKACTAKGGTVMGM